MDHHCPWINNCIGIGNFRFFVQLLLHVSMGSFFTLFCIYLVSHTPIWYQTVGSSWVFICMHSIFAFGFFAYYLYNMWLVNRDLTSFDLFYRQDKARRYIRFIQLTFDAKLWLLFGTPSVFQASFYPLIGNLPMSGLEYTTETQVTNFDNFNPYQIDF